MSVVGLDLRELRLPTPTFLPSTLWPDGPHTIHLLAPDLLRSPNADDQRVQWHTDLPSAWQAWSATFP